MKRTILTMLTVFALSVVMFYGCESKEPAAESGTGKIAPDFTLTNYDDKPISLSDYESKIRNIANYNSASPYKCIGAYRIAADDGTVCSKSSSFFY